MRIGFSTLMIQRGHTGVAQHIFALLRQFKAWTGEHQFVLFVLQEDLPLFDFAQETMEIVPVPEEYRPPVRNILWHQRELPPLIRKRGIDLMHTPSYRRLLWPRPCALVGTIHDLAPFHLAGKYDWRRMVYGRVVVRRLAHRQHRIIAISQFTAQDIVRFFRVPSSRLKVIYNGIDHDRFFPESTVSDDALKMRRYHLRSPFFLYIARLEHPAKNHVRLIDAFNRFRGQSPTRWHLVLGGGDWHGAERIHEAVRSSPYSRDIASLGFVADANIPALYRAADVFMYPSLFEGFGLPPLEAMACGCPVICSTRGSLGEVIGDAALTVDPEDVDDIKEKMLQLANDPGLRQTLRTAGLAQAQRFDWRRASEQTLEVYHEALNRR